MIFLEVGSAMLDSQFFTNAMNEVDAAIKNGHFITPQAFIRQTGQHSEYLQLSQGKTSHPLFEMLNNPNMTYRVKAKVSASDAIESLLNSHQTIVDCGVTMAVMYNLAVLRMMESKLGSVNGRKRFDEIFGSKNTETPSKRRLVISPFSLVMGTEFISNIDLLPVQPLSFFTQMTFAKHKKEIESTAKIGWQLILRGDPNYIKLHGAGEFAAYNIVVTSVNPLKVRSSDIPGVELTEDDIIKHHIDAYAETPSFESFLMLEPAYRNSQEFVAFSKTPTSKNQIPGFISGMLAINEEKLNFLLTGPVEQVVAALSQHIQEMEQKCLSQKYNSVTATVEKEVQRNLSTLSLASDSSTASTSDSKKPVPADYLSDLSAGFAKAFVSKPKAAAGISSAPAPVPPAAVVKKPPEPEFAGLKGLAGAFAKKPVAAASEKPLKPAANQDKVEQGGSKRGLKKGFFN